MVARRDCVIDLKVTSADYPEDETRHSGVGDYGTFTFHSSGGRGQVHLSAHRRGDWLPRFSFAACNLPLQGRLGMAFLQEG